MSRHCMTAMIFAWIIGSAVVSAGALEIRGQVATDNFVWNPQNFAGFDYDIDQDIGSETLTTTITEGRVLSGDGPYGLTYVTSKRLKSFSTAAIDMKYGKLTVLGIDPATGMIMLNNKDGRIALSRNANTEIMPGLWIKTANNDTLRYYIYKNITTPGTYEVRGQVATDSWAWNPQNFAGFYYDLKKDLGTETLTTTITEGNKLSGSAPYGVIFQTTAQGIDHAYRDWGTYLYIGFLSKEYFAGYAYTNPLYWESDYEGPRPEMTLHNILLDKSTRITLKKGESIKLKEGYELFLRGFNSLGQIYLELKKDGILVDESFLALSAWGSSVRDSTYIYRANTGLQSGLAMIAVHFKGAYKDDERGLAIVDGIWQISDAVTTASSGVKFGKMTIRSVDTAANTITMDNKDNPITLERNTDVELAPDIYIRTADNETLRYYLYRKVKVE